MILILTDSDRDFLADQLAHGFCALLGPDQVVDFPQKLSLRWTADPIFDCDYNLPVANWNIDEVLYGLTDRRFDLIVIPTVRGHVRAQLFAWQRADLLRRNRDRIVFVDGEDDPLNRLPLVGQCLGFAPAAIFKRELPFDETWAQPLPFAYAAERIVTLRDTWVAEGREANVVYTVQIWQWAVGGLRENIAATLRRSGRAIVHVSYSDSDRCSVTHYHAMNRRRMAAVSPAGRGWGCNRHLEVIADGCCPLIERPWRQWPDALIDGVECRYFTNEVDCIDIVEELLDDPVATHEMAKAAQAALLRSHTTRHRAETVWKAIHGSFSI